MANEWREHPMLKGRFAPDHPDDLQVVVHDGGPQITRNEPEVVWVTVTGMEGDVFRGRVGNQPNNLQTVHRGDEIKFVVPEGDAPADLLELVAKRLGLHPAVLTGWLAPVRVTDKYLRERGAWIIHPCPQCGLSELFDAPSDLMRVVFPQPRPAAAISMFTASCPHCGGVQSVESRSAGGNLGGTYLGIAKLRAENMTAIGRLLAAIQDDASADVALPKLEKAIARHNDLSKKIESYKLSVEDHRKLAQEHYKEYLATTSDMTVSTAAAQSNAILAQSKALGKARDIEAAMKKIE